MDGRKCIRGTSNRAVFFLIKWINGNADYDEIFLGILEKVDGKDISDMLFKKLISLKNQELQNRVLISLCHKHLTVPQLTVLCKTNAAFESYFELIAIVYESASYSAKQFQKALDDFKTCFYKDMEPDLLEELKTRYMPSVPQKRDILLHYMKMLNL